jgi:hypothetical protein
MTRSKPRQDRLAAGHGWRAQANHKILVLGRGAVRLEIPQAWVVEPDDDGVKVFDKKPPDDDCTLTVSYHHWPAAGAKLSVASLVRSVLENDERSFFAIDPLVEQTRIDIVLAWAQGRFIDTRSNREACGRLCIARSAGIQALLTFDFWSSDLAACDPRWSMFLATLQLGQWVADPLRGPSLS